MQHRRFDEYCEARENTRLVVEWLVENGHEITEEAVTTLVEAGFFDKVRQFGRKAALPLALSAGLGGSSGAASPHWGDKQSHQSTPAAHAPAHMRPSHPVTKPQHQRPPQHRPAPPQQHRPPERRPAPPQHHRPPEHHPAPPRVHFDHTRAVAVASYINRALVSQQHYIQVTITDFRQDGDQTVLMLSVTSGQGMARYNSRAGRQRLLDIIRSSLERQGFQVQNIRVVDANNAVDTVRVRGYEATDEGREELFQVEVVISGGEQ